MSDRDRVVAVVEMDGHPVLSFETGKLVEFEHGRLRVWHTIYGDPKTKPPYNYSGSLEFVFHNDGRPFTITGYPDPDHRWAFYKEGKETR